MNYLTFHRIRVDYAEGGVAGHVSLGGCENPRCHEGTRDGRPWHAIPQGFAVTLPDNHYATAREAAAAILGASTALEDRLRSITVSQYPTDGDAVDGWEDVLDELSAYFAANPEHQRDVREALAGLPNVDTWAEVIRAAAQRIYDEARPPGFLDDGFSELAEERLLDVLNPRPLAAGHLTLYAEDAEIKELSYA